MLLFHCLLPVIATDRAHRTPYTYAVLLLRARKPDKLVYLHPDCQPTRTAMRPPIFISHALRETYTQFCRKSPYTPAFAAELPLDDPPRPFRLPLFPQAVQGSAFHYVLVSCGTYVLSFAKTSTFIEVFARLCIFIHCVIACFSPMRLLLPSCDPFPIVAPRRTIAPRRRSAAFVAEPLIAARACRFRRRSFAVRFFHFRASLFLISRSLFASCTMAHANFLFVFLCLRLFALSLR